MKIWYLKIFEILKNLHFKTIKNHNNLHLHPFLIPSLQHWLMVCWWLTICVPSLRHNSVYVLTLMIGGAARDLLITICQAY